MNTSLTLPQLVEQFSKVTATKANDVSGILQTYHSIGIEGGTLTLLEIQNLLQKGIPPTDKFLVDQLRIVDHHNALQQVLTMANEHIPLNRTIIQELASTLMYHTGGPIYSLLSQYDTSQGKLRIDDKTVGRRVLIDFHKLPRALDNLLKEVNTAITRLRTPRQIYDLSFTAHFQLLTLHPFGEGNGPMARLLMNYIQQFHQQPISLIHVDSRNPYLNSLDASWRLKSPTPIVSFMHSQLVRFLQECIEQH
jgi:Fic family protein